MSEKRNEIAEAIAYAARHLGNNDACTPMGALEALGKVHKEQLEELAQEIAGAIHSHSYSLDRCAEALNRIADAIRCHLPDEP